MTRIGFLLFLLTLSEFAASEESCPLVQPVPTFRAECDPGHPRYPASAIRRHLQGVVSIEVTVPAGGGKPLDAKVVSEGGDPLLTESALKSVEHSCWSSLERDGTPSCYRVVYPVTFHITQK